jgi:hypothetical protein
MWFKELFKLSRSVLGVTLIIPIRADTTVKRISISIFMATGDVG